MNTKAGYIGIVGKPNVGKSTLLNHILGEFVSIISPKPQTTRDKILGIHTKNNTQFIFLDSPGIHNSTKVINQYMISEAVSTILDSDIVLFLVEFKGDFSFDEMEIKIIKFLEKFNKNTILILNKMDLSNNIKTDFDNIMKYLENFKIFKDVIPLSAKNGIDTNLFLKQIEKFIPNQQFFYPENYLTDRNDRFFVSEVIREKIFLLTYQEVPYDSSVVVEKYNESKGSIVIDATIIVAKESQKGVIIGKGGLTLQKIGMNARKDIEKNLNKKIILNLFVKVETNWNSNKDKLKQIGYEQKDINIEEFFK